MKIARISTQNGVFYAEVREDGYHLILGDIFGECNALADKYEGEAKLLAPVAPSKVVCLGANYKKHAEELHLNVLSEPTIFIKPATSVIASGDAIVYPKCATKVDYESELAVVIGKKCRNVKAEHAFDYVFGVTCANDVTERNMQAKDGQWTRAKSFDTFCPLGPYINTDFGGEPLEIIGRRNGEVVQHGNTRDFITDIARAIEFIGGIMTLEAGDVILTGTPAGIGALNVGDTFEVEIEGIGLLQNKVTEE